MTDEERAQPPDGFSFGADTAGRSRRRPRDRSFLPSVRALVLAAAVVAAGIAGIAVLSIATAGSPGADVRARASAICGGAQRELKSMRESPDSLGEALQIEHSALSTYGREISRLDAVGRGAGTAFRSGVADDRALLAGLDAMIARPDFVELSITLPGHPQLAPAWLKTWLAHSHALLNDAHAQFSRAGIPACEKSLG